MTAGGKFADEEILPAAKFVAEAFLPIFDRQKRSPSATCKPLGLQPCDWICRSQRARQIHRRKRKLHLIFYISVQFLRLWALSALCAPTFVGAFSYEACRFLRAARVVGGA
ncbi:MAG TPA: hypothetical protein IAB20_03880 [Candidatus Pullichristensenella excrementipullorum]|nr:hypothetical protein [Candidatus Pullichristensenella excrementipullorum]